MDRMDPLEKKIKTQIVDNFEHQGKDVKGGGVTGSNPKGPVQGSNPNEVRFTVRFIQ